MIKSKAVFIVALLCLTFSVTNAADIIYVDANSPNDPGTGTWNDPFRRIQDAINSSITGDTVEIRPGVYTGAGNYNLDPNGKSITIRSIDFNAPDIIAGTIIDPNQSGRGFYLHNKEDANCIISGLTIKNAYTSGFGAGIYCDNASPTVTNCVIKDNFSEGYGSGICSINSTSQIRNCIISNNRGRYGGGIGCFESTSIIVTNCTISSNAVIFSGGGVFCDMEGHVVIINSIILANKIDYPEEEHGPQVCLFAESSASISYTDIEGGFEDIASIESTLYWLSGNIEIDPCFVSFDPNGDPNFWDFHLKSTSGRWNPVSSEWVIDTNLSQCIDAGDPNSDWSQEPWPNGKRINMGAYGGTNQASKKGLKADFDVDGYVDFVDFSYLASKWNLQQSCIEDLNGSGNVDIYDFGEFCVSWLTQ